MSTRLGVGGFTTAPYGTFTKTEQVDAAANKFLYFDQGTGYITTSEMRHILLVDGVDAPAAVSGYAVLYIDTSDGDFKIKFSDGVVKTLAVDT